MAQHDYNIANATGAVVRTDLNNALTAIATNNSGPSAPATTFANMWWFDTTNDLLKVRDEANSAWVTVAKKDGTGWTPYRQGVALGTASVQDDTRYAHRANNLSDLADVTEAREALELNIVGGVLAFAVSSPPTGWLECDGSAVSRTTYADLFAAISDDYGSGDGSTTFNIPDLRGEFIRGWDHGAGNDPDAASRTDRGDSTTGDFVGTKQADAFESHSHTTPQNYRTASGGTAFGGVGGNMGTDNGTDATGGNETRPRNVNVMFCIKY